MVPVVIPRVVRWVARRSLRVLTGLAAMALVLGAAVTAPAPDSATPAPDNAAAASQPRAQAAVEVAQQPSADQTLAERATTDDSAAVTAGWAGSSVAGGEGDAAHQADSGVDSRADSTADGVADGWAVRAAPAIAQEVDSAGVISAPSAQRAGKRLAAPLGQRAPPQV